MCHLKITTLSVIVGALGLIKKRTDETTVIKYLLVPAFVKYEILKLSLFGYPFEMMLLNLRINFFFFFFFFFLDLLGQKRGAIDNKYGRQ